MLTAGVGSVKKVGGYRNMRFLNPLPDRYMCPVCKSALRNPMQTFCGHRVCAACLPVAGKARSDAEFRCPECNEVLIKQHIFSDKVALREVLDLVCYCPAEARGCSWRGELRGVEEHQKSCEFELVLCKNQGCKKEVLRKNLEMHVSENCSYRSLTCEYCNTKIIKHLLQEHYQVCPDFPVICRNNCGKTSIPRKLLSEHVTKECQNAENNCLFSTSGCNFKEINPYCPPNQYKLEP